MPRFGDLQIELPALMYTVNPYRITELLIRLRTLVATLRRWFPPQVRASLETRLRVPLEVTRTVRAWVVPLVVPVLRRAAHTPRRRIPGRRDSIRATGLGLRTQLIMLRRLGTLCSQVALEVHRVNGRQPLRRIGREVGEVKRSQSRTIRLIAFLAKSLTSLPVSLEEVLHAGPLVTLE